MLTVTWHLWGFLADRLTSLQMEITDLYLTAYLRTKGFQSQRPPRLDPATNKIVWEFEECPQLTSCVLKYYGGDGGILLMKEQLAIAWKEILEVTPREAK